MEDWLQKNFNKILSIICGILLFLIGLVGWFLNRTVIQYDDRFNEQSQIILKEVVERKEVDKDLQMQINNMVESKISYREYQTMQEDVTIIKQDIKDILRNQKR